MGGGGGGRTKVSRAEDLLLIGHVAFLVTYNVDTAGRNWLSKFDEWEEQLLRVSGEGTREGEEERDTNTEVVTHYFRTPP